MFMETNLGCDKIILSNISIQGLIVEPIFGYLSAIDRLQFCLVSKTIYDKIIKVTIMMNAKEMSSLLWKITPFKLSENHKQEVCCQLLNYHQRAGITDAHQPPEIFRKEKDVDSSIEKSLTAKQKAQCIQCFNDIILHFCTPVDITHDEYNLYLEAYNQTLHSPKKFGRCSAR